MTFHFSDERSGKLYDGGLKSMLAIISSRLSFLNSIDLPLKCKEDKFSGAPAMILMVVVEFKSPVKNILSSLIITFLIRYPPLIIAERWFVPVNGVFTVFAC